MDAAVRKNQNSEIAKSRTVYIDKINVSNKPYYEKAKRMFDIIVSFFALIILSPVMLLTAIAVFLQDFHNPFFIQTRLTKDGKEFKMFKFRSMCVDAEDKLDELRNFNEVDGPAFKIKKDPRITKIGRILRRTSIDELPQLLNVMGGSMSLVGPRPPLPEEAEHYSSYQRHRLDVKGGLTCYWQCSGRSNISFEQWMDLDIQYIKERSFITDIKIIFKTVKSVLVCEGAE